MKPNTTMMIVTLFVTACGGENNSTSSAPDTSQSKQGAQQCADCAKDSDCGDGLTCDKPAFVCKTPKQVQQKSIVCDYDCAESDQCALDGLCSIAGKYCKAKTLAHCIASERCRLHGGCTLSEGVCVIASDSDCRKSNDCAVESKCTFKDGKCVPTTGTKCGDGKCEGNESKQNCAQDCGPVGGDPCPCAAGACGITPGCPNDCGTCGAGKWCSVNQCTDAKCALPSKWPQAAQRITKLVMLHQKAGCDLDDSGKPNNMLGNLLKVYQGVNEHAFNALQAKTLNLLLVAEDYNAANKPFSISLVEADLDKTAGACNERHSACKFLAKSHSYDGLANTETCPPRSQLNGAQVTNNTLVAGGKGTNVNLAVYVVGVPLVAKLRSVTVTGTVSGGSEWQTTTSGQLCGALLTKDLNAAVESLPASALLGTGFDKKKVKELVAALFTADLDLDGDGVFDAMSGAWSFETGPAELLGVK